MDEHAAPDQSGVDPTRPLTPKDVAEDLNDDFTDDGDGDGDDTDDHDEGSGPSHDGAGSTSSRMPPD